MINLPNVTIVCIDCLNYESAIKALKHSITKIQFGKALFLSDKKFKSRFFDSKIIDRINSKENYSKFMIQDLNKFIKTDFCLVL